MASLDVADSSRRMLADENDMLRALVRIKRFVAEPLLKRHRGVMFKTMGDGGLVEFDSVEDAVGFTLDFQDAMASRNADAAQPIRFRAAVALADVLVDGDDRFGWAIGFLVHLQQVAPPGGVVITHSVRWQLTAGLAGRFTRAETRRVKGVDELLEVWIKAPDGLPEGMERPLSPLSAPVATPRSQKSERARASVMVAPFVNRAGPDGAKLIDSVMDELIRTLAHLDEFALIASERAAPGDAADSCAAAVAAGAHYLLSGALRASGDRARISAQLLDAHTHRVLWSDRVDGDVRDAFALEDAAAGAIAGAVRAALRACDTDDDPPAPQRELAADGAETNIVAFSRLRR